MSKEKRKRNLQFYRAMEKIMDIFKEAGSEKGFKKRDFRDLNLGIHHETIKEIIKILNIDEGYIINESKTGQKWGTTYHYNPELDNADIEFSSKAHASLIEAGERDLAEEKKKENPNPVLIQFWRNQIYYWQTCETKQSAIRGKLLQSLYLHTAHVKHPEWIKWLQKYWTKYVRRYDYQKVEELNKKIPLEEWEFELKIRVKQKKEGFYRYESEEFDEDETGEYIYTYIQLFEKAGNSELIYDPTRENKIIYNEKGEPIGISGNKHYIGKREGPTLKMLKEWLDVKIP